MAGWRAFWTRILSPPTARFILALLSLIASSGATLWLMTTTIEPETKDVVVFAVGQMFALTAMAFGYYFGSTARGDERPVEAHIVNQPTDPVPTTDSPDWPTFKDALK